METKEIISKIAERMGRERDDVQKLLDAFSVALKERCGELDSIAIPGFGTFEPRKKMERIVVNPANGKRMLVPPKVILNFKTSNVLKSKFK